QGGGDVTLEAAKGSILDATFELDVVASGDFALTPFQQHLMDVANGDAPKSFSTVTPIDKSGTVVLDLGVDGAFKDQQEILYSYDAKTGKPIGGLVDGGKYFTVLRPDGNVELAASLDDAKAGKAIDLVLDLVDGGDGVTGTGHRLGVFDTDPSNDITADAFRFPLSPGLYSSIYPHAAFPGSAPTTVAPEINNVVGQTVTLVADGGGGIGRAEPATIIDLSHGFDKLSDANKGLLSTATSSDVIGVQYAVYRNIGASTAGTFADMVAAAKAAFKADLEDGDGVITTPTPSDHFASFFGTNPNQWQKVTPIVTGVSRAPNVQTVAHDAIVLVEFDSASYGLYQYKGTSGSFNLSAERFDNAARWDKLTLRSTDDTLDTAIASNQLVLDKFVVERVALQLQDDVDIHADRLVVEADGNVALQSADELKIDHARAGGDVRLNSGLSIIDLHTAGTDAAVSSFGAEVVITSNGAIQGSNPADAFRMQLADTTQLFADAPGNIKLQQVGTDTTINGASRAIDDLHIAKVHGGAAVDIRVAEGDMTIEKVDAATSAVLIAQHSIADAQDDAAAPLINVATGDLYLEATTGSIGASSNLLDIHASGDVSGLAGKSAYLNSPEDLNITLLRALDGAVVLRVSGSSTPGNTNIGLIQAHKGTVDIITEASIIDRDKSKESDAVIEAKNLDLVAHKGTIGTVDNPLEIDSSYLSDGYVNADAQGRVFLVETKGTLNASIIRSHTTDVDLDADGSILDFGADTANNVTGVNINLTARHGDIGTATDALEIDSSNPSQGRLNASALNSSINIAETDGPLYVGTVLAATGDARLSVRDSTNSGEDLIMDSKASINAPSGFVLLRVGDNVDLQPGSQIHAGVSITIHGDTDDLGKNADPEPTLIQIEGTLTSAYNEIAGERQGDTIIVRPELIVGWTRVLGDTDGLPGGDDLIVVDHMTTPLDLDGRGGTDTYIVYTHGSEAAGKHDYIVNVLDSGAKDDGLDTLTIEGTRDNDIFLLRRMSAITEGASSPLSANTPAFVALLHGTLADVRNPDLGARRQDVERINYDENANSRLIVRGFAGNDYFAVDDNAAITTLDGGAGDDTFQIGQIYGSPRISMPDGGHAASVAAGDEFFTVATTAGFLSRGATFALTAYGGTGNDKFTVYSNKAELRLEGNDGNDDFIIRAFALVSGTGVSTEDTTQAIGGEGTDTIQYNVNAPVDLDGGAGFDKVIIIGTEFADNFVITDQGVFGAGLNVRYQNVEAVEVDGLEGDDHFTILSTNRDVVTTIIGGLGNDTFDVAGDVPDGSIVSQDLEGRSGIINHQVSATAADPVYDGLLAAGVNLHVASAKSGQVVIEEGDGSTVVNEQGETTDTYTVKLAAAPEHDKPVYINVSAARTTQEEEDASVAGDSMLIKAGGGQFGRYLVLKFDDSNWDVAQTVTVKAVDDQRIEGERVYAISHSAQSADARFDHAAIKNVKVTVFDNDKPEVIVAGSGDSNTLLEGNATTQITDTYSVRLGKPVTSGTVTVSLDFDTAQLSLASADARFDAASRTIVFNSTNWSDPVALLMTATPGDGPEDTMIQSIRHTADAGYGAATFNVTIVDGDTPGVYVNETDGGTLVVKDDPATPANEGVSDTYSLRLTKAPVGTVTITPVTDGQTFVTPTPLSFNAANWWVPQVVT
ncbi:MAG: hypothetical protein DMF94_34420, partial [Acidobacteria bacterium]